jgi:citrate lyase subunit beta / citryl-CoA lyase
VPVFRSMLFAPGNHARRVEKAFKLGADAVILDLEDACPVPAKAAARPDVVKALQQPRDCLGYVRINALSTEFAYQDLRAVVVAGVDGIVVPKVESMEEIKTVEWLVTQLERERGLATGALDIIPILESGAGIAAAGAIAGAGTRVRRMAFGAGDLTLDLGLEWSREEIELLPYRSAVVLASRTANIEPPVDTVWVDLQDQEGFRMSAERSRRMGFQGKLCIHPDQIVPTHQAFTPTDADFARAKRVVEAFYAAEAQGSAAFQLDGQFVDYPIVYKAQRVLATMERISARNGPAHA